MHVNRANIDSDRNFVLVQDRLQRGLPPDRPPELRLGSAPGLF